MSTEVNLLIPLGKEANLTYDRDIVITTGKSRRDIKWRAEQTTLTRLWQRMRTAERGTETLADYLSLSKDEQDTLKDHGGYVAGTLSGPRRKAAAVNGRDLVTLDLDNIPAGGTSAVLAKIRGLGCGFLVHSTRKHRPEAPRLRLLLPLSRTVTADEYQPVARRMAERVGLALCDPSTFEAHRLMYWPTVCSDGEYICETSDAPLLDADAVLDTYTDWRLVSLWPQIPGGETGMRKGAEAGDPTEKPGIVGAFCRAYDVVTALTELIPDAYLATEDPRRYTYAHGTTAQGAIIYGGGLWLYSHHATDPCCGQLVNAFDLVRLHKFRGLDEGKREDTPLHRLPSYREMAAYAAGLPAVKARLLQERQEAAAADFAGLTEGSKGGAGDSQAQELKLDSKGNTLPTANNIKLLIERDSTLHGKIVYNRFSARIEVRGRLMWRPGDEDDVRRPWDDTDLAGLRWYLETYYKIRHNSNTDEALALYADQHSVDDVVDYLEGLTWDGTKRLDTLLIDYLGAEDTPYTRAVTRKSFVGAVARAMEPGCKFDTMLVLIGPQGIGKSTLLDLMSKGWFNDSIRTFEGKEASELLQGVWLVEVAEMNAFNRSDVNSIKQFLTQRFDRYRAAYGRNVRELPRRCVFFGTTNTSEFLRDPTGNRRFWPVDVEGGQTKQVWTDLPGEVDQIWAEAMMRWKLGEPLILPPELSEAALAQQLAHTETDTREGEILLWLEREVPFDWQDWPLDKRLMFWDGTAAYDGPLVPRDRVCAREVCCEALRLDKRYLKQTDIRAINTFLQTTLTTLGWERKKYPTGFGCYGNQRGFTRQRLPALHFAETGQV